MDQCIENTQIIGNSHLTSKLILSIQNYKKEVWNNYNREDTAGLPDLDKLEDKKWRDMVSALNILGSNGPNKEDMIVYDTN